MKYKQTITITLIVIVILLLITCIVIIQTIVFVIVNFYCYYPHMKYVQANHARIADSQSIEDALGCRRSVWENNLLMYMYVYVYIYIYIHIDT